MVFEIIFDREQDGRWIAEIKTLPGVLAYGDSKQEPLSRVEALAVRVISDRIESEKSTTGSVRSPVGFGSEPRCT
jgi:predicted RNase H-like HicB family nuclease